VGTAERKAKEKLELSNLILKAARKLFLENGVENTTIRNIAEAIDYSIGTVYVYYKDKNEILYALHKQGFSELSGQFKILYNVIDPMERLRAMGKVYMKFANENAEMYDLMFNLKAPMEFLKDIYNEEWNEGKATFDVVRSTAAECIKKGHFKGHKAEPLAFMIWSMVHGMCSLEIRQRTKGVALEHPETILEDGYNEFLKMIEKL
jgi:AcrR family transcriptional regulator